MLSRFALLALPALFLFCSARALSVHERSARPVLRTENGIHIPIYKEGTPIGRKRGQTSTIGLGDSVDATYNVLLTVGGITIPLVLDTGSSDLWVLSDACSACGTGVPLYPQSTFKSAGLDIRLLYGDSQTGTHAFGLIGRDTVDLAGLRLADQYFAAINDTSTSVMQSGSAGIFGLGFTVNSFIWRALLVSKQAASNKATRRLGNASPDDYARSEFPNLTDPHSNQGPQHHALQVSPSAPTVFDSYSQIAPFLGRLVYTNGLSAPMFTVTLQRDTVDVGGNAGLLSIGELPSGVSNGSLTWVPVRRYTTSQGGPSPPPESPNEQYPITWELFVDDVYLDGQKLPRSTLSSPTIALSALLDTGNSLLRGPADVVRFIRDKLGAQFPCSEPHTLTFQIGGKLFPVDPRDFVTQSVGASVATCRPNLVATDPPSEGNYLYSWSLGDPFLKSVLSAYYLGNLSYPSQDPPRIGVLSTVPANADALLRAAVQAAARSGGNLPFVSESAPSGIPETTKTNSDGIPEAQSTIPSNNVTPNAAPRLTIVGWPLALTTTLVSGVLVLHGH